MSISTRVRPAAAAVFAAILALATAIPAQAAPTRIRYDALGDSFAAGTGAGDPLDPCARTAAPHPQILSGRMQLQLDDFAACAGAGLDHVAMQIQTALDAETRLVTLSLGGNELDWITAIQTCATFPGSCALIAEQGRQTAALLPTALVPIYAAARAMAPNAQLVVTGYPRLFSPEYGDYSGVYMGMPFTLPAEDQTGLNSVIDALNTSIAQAALAVPGTRYVDVTQRFIGHGVNAPSAWITGASAAAPLHPTSQGQRAYAAAVTAVVEPGALR
ncbi:SGNH/GDSL hydrolase family protein [Tessaracoccus sp. MC1865]|uniref:SGNH/GDSL hydrolase family protein n=1 Tax=Tessaracoccus sp. MC1865 TaxID=2760310 RepID=UPI001604335B|nr:SGNH/GDSL hydrolase family protein [Tessaracoccus sp. MC1865]MBB1483963.1 SGNH/GDSL hydrolase family protein [Tessaracoccus sp. MC1865]QTO37010.1 SGNH/GDSL hydrolase family protein [Tessaracoccus sp. MC1865]